MLVELITCRALGLMRIAHLQSISSARTHELNTITFTHLTQLHITILRAVLRVLGEPTLINLTPLPNRAIERQNLRPPLPLQMFLSLLESLQIFDNTHISVRREESMQIDI